MRSNLDDFLSSLTDRLVFIEIEDEFIKGESNENK